MIRHQVKIQDDPMLKCDGDGKTSGQAFFVRSQLLAKFGAGGSGKSSRGRLSHKPTLPYCQRFDLDAKIDPDLDEFSVIDPALIEGLDGAQRKPYVKAYSAEPDLHRRLGENADTFAEFIERVRRFQIRMDTLTDGAVIFGHGIWLALLSWLL